MVPAWKRNSKSIIFYDPQRCDDLRQRGSLWYLRRNHDGASLLQQKSGEDMVKGERRASSDILGLGFESVEEKSGHFSCEDLNRIRLDLFLKKKAKNSAS